MSRLQLLGERFLVKLLGKRSIFLRIILAFVLVVSIVVGIVVLAVVLIVLLAVVQIVALPGNSRGQSHEHTGGKLEMQPRFPFE